MVVTRDPVSACFKGWLRSTAWYFGLARSDPLLPGTGVLFRGEYCLSYEESYWLVRRWAPSPSLSPL